MKNEAYKHRIIDETAEQYLNAFGAVCIEGPKWCGKTWTSRTKIVTVNAKGKITAKKKTGTAYIADHFCSESDIFFFQQESSNGKFEGEDYCKEKGNSDNYR